MKTNHAAGQQNQAGPVSIVQPAKSSGMSADIPAPRAARARAALLTNSDIRDLEILAFIRTYAAAHHYPPTIREIGKGTGITSTSVVNYHLDKLEDEGKLRRTRGITRGIELVELRAVAATEARLRVLVDAAKRWRAAWEVSAPTGKISPIAESILVQAVDALEVTP